MTNKYQEVIYKKYASAILPKTKLIDGKYLYEREYECLSFKKFMKISFPDTNVFIDDSKLDQLYQHLEACYGYNKNTIDKYRYFSENGLLLTQSEITISNLKFFQDEIKIDRLDFLACEKHISEPVLVVKVEEDFVLFDGYHRTFISLLDGKGNIICHIL